MFGDSQDGMNCGLFFCILFSVDFHFRDSHSWCQALVSPFIAIWAFGGFTTRTTSACFLSLFHIIRECSVVGVGTPGNKTRINPRATEVDIVIYKAFTL